MAPKQVTLAIAALFAGFSLAFAVDLPQLKEGLWLVTAEATTPTGAKQAGIGYKLCRNHGYDLAVQANARKLPGCTLVSESHLGNEYTTVTHCETGGQVIDSRSVTRYVGDTEVRTETTAKYKHPVAGKWETSTVLTQKYSGACLANMNPGDRVSPSGQVLHIRE